MIDDAGNLRTYRYRGYSLYGTSCRNAVLNICLTDSGGIKRNLFRITTPCKEEGSYGYDDYRTYENPYFTDFLFSYIFIIGS